MFQFLKKKSPENAPPPSVSPVSLTPHNSQQRSDVRRELIRVVLKDTLRLHGIPFGWLACEVIIVARAPGEEELHIQLVVMKWNDQLLRYALALQRQLLLGLDRFDPSVDHSKYIVAWRFSPDCGSPFPLMPAPSIWLQSTLPLTKEVPVSVLDRRRTQRPENASVLPPSSFAPKDRTEFAPTQLFPLL